MFYTYLWLREDGTPYYVGKGYGRRAYQNKDHCVYRPKYDSLIIVQHWDSEEKSFEMEKWWIEFWGRKDIGNGILRNMTDGGDGPSGWVPTEETKEKIKEARKYQVCTEETRKKMSLSHIGFKHSDETKQKIRRAQKGVPKPHTHSVSEEHLRKMHAGRWPWLTTEDREKHLQITKERRKEYNKARMREIRRKQKCQQTLGLTLEMENP